MTGRAAASGPSQAGARAAEAWECPDAAAPASATSTPRLRVVRGVQRGLELLAAPREVELDGALRDVERPVALAGRDGDDDEVGRYRRRLRALKAGVRDGVESRLREERGRRASHAEVMAAHHARADRLRHRPIVAAGGARRHGSVASSATTEEAGPHLVEQAGPMAHDT
jgi:hypothetical protein